MITIYTKNNCPYCDQAKALLESRNIKYEAVNIEQHPDARQKLVEAGLRSVPQIYKDNKLIPGGFQGLSGLSPEEFAAKVGTPN
jgi:glutaredoxin